MLNHFNEALVKLFFYPILPGILIFIYLIYLFNQTCFLFLISNSLLHALWPLTQYLKFFQELMFLFEIMFYSNEVHLIILTKLILFNLLIFLNFIQNHFILSLLFPNSQLTKSDLLRVIQVLIISFLFRVEINLLILNLIKSFFHFLNVLNSFLLIFNGNFITQYLFNLIYFKHPKVFITFR